MLKNLTMSFSGPTEKDCINYLGVLIDENLSWRKHIVMHSRPLR